MGIGEVVVSQGVICYLFSIVCRSRTGGVLTAWGRKTGRCGEVSPRVGRSLERGIPEILGRMDEKVQDVERGLGFWRCVADRGEATLEVVSLGLLASN